MGFLFASKKEFRTTLIFDIGSGSVAGALVQIPTDTSKIPTILKSVRVDIQTRKVLDFNLFIDDMNTALHEVCVSLYEAKVAPPEDIVCTLASPWYVSETKSIKLAKEKAFIFTEKIADELLKREITDLEEIYYKKYGGKENAPERMETHVMSVSLNGYHVVAPLGKRTTALEMNMFVSLSPKLCLDRIRQTIAQTYHTIPVSFSSFVCASYVAVRDRFEVPDSYVLMDIGGEITDITLISKGILKLSVSFPFGKNTVYKMLVNHFDIEPRDAQEILALYFAGTLASSRQEVLTPYLKEIEQAWKLLFKECMAALPRTLVIPDTVFLTIDTDMKKYFTDILSREDHFQSMNENHTVTIKALEGPEFLTMCGLKESTCDPFLMMEAIACMRKKNTYV